MRRPTSRRSAAEPSRSATVRIARIGADGDGVASSDGVADDCYIPFTLPGELVRATLTGKRGIAEAILELSRLRVDPPCPHFGTCGGCSLQHWRDEDYAAWKVAEVAAALARAGFENASPGALARTPPGARRRLDLALRRAGNGVVVGLHRLRSDTVADLDVCPVAHPRLVALVQALRLWLPKRALLRREGSALLNLLDTGPDVLLRTDAEPSAADRASAAQFAHEHGVPRLFWAAGNGTPEPLAIVGTARMAFGDAVVTPPPGAFLQASPEGEAAIRAAVLAGLPERLKPRATIVELYAGCGTLTFALAARGRVVAYEGDAAAVAALRQAAPPGRIAPTQRDLVRQPLSARELAGVAVVVVDPPYAGAAPQIAEIARAGVPRVIYVSCNPAALTRDARMLRGAGYALDAVTVVDQFLWSSRVESVCVFVR